MHVSEKSFKKYVQRSLEPKEGAGCPGEEGTCTSMLGQSWELSCALALPGVALTYPEGHTAGGLVCTLGTAAALGTIFLQTVLSGNTALKGSPTL